MEPVSLSSANGCDVKSIESGSAVSKDGRLSVGDYIMSVNNECTRRITSSQARAILRCAALIGTDIRLTMRQRHHSNFSFVHLILYTLEVTNYNFIIIFVIINMYYRHLIKVYQWHIWITLLNLFEIYLLILILQILYYNISIVVYMFLC